MSSPHRFKLLVGGVLVTALLSGSGCGVAKEDKQSQATSGTVRPPIGTANSAKSDPKIDLRTVKADFVTDADSWYDEWKKDREAAQKKYKGKVIELGGTVDDANDDPYLKVGYIYLKLKKSMYGLRCASDDLAPWLKVGPECTIKLRGVVSESGLTGELYPCVIVESSPNTSLEITASQLAKEFAADSGAAVKKYHEKRLIVEGELVGQEPSKADEGRFIYLTLKGDGAVNVRCYVSNNSAQRQKASEDLKVGQKLRVCGEADIDVNAKGPEISWPGSRLVTPVK